MIYVGMQGLLGNQMFSYAFAKSLQLEFGYKDDISFDFRDSSYKEQGNQLKQFKCNDIHEKDRDLSIIQRGILFLYFGVRKKKALDVDFSTNLQMFEKRWAGVLNLFGIYSYSFGYYQFKHKTLFRNKLVLGFYESPQYFVKYDKYIREDFQLNNKSKDCDLLMKTIENDEVTIGVGIRTVFYSNSLRSTCSIGYVKRGIQYIVDKCRHKNQEPVVYIFSDTEDIKQIEEELRNSDIKYRYVTQKKYNLSPAEKLICMSKCSHFVINNSTFEWWAQHLGNSSDKIVVAPDIWRNEPENLWRDIYEENWVLLNGKEKK